MLSKAKLLASNASPAVQAAIFSNIACYYEKIGQDQQAKAHLM